MPFAADEVRRLARAARLTLAPGEEDALARDLDRILDAFGSLPALAGPGAGPGDAAAEPRPDEPRPGDPDVLRNAPRRDGDLVRVPRRGA